MDIDYLIKHHNIKLENLGSTYDEYYENFKDANVTEQHIFQIMNTLQNADFDCIFL